jgi:hypothetical protein
MTQRLRGSQSISPPFNSLPSSFSRCRLVRLYAHARSHRQGHELCREQPSGVPVLQGLSGPRQLRGERPPGRVARGHEPRRGHAQERRGRRRVLFVQRARGRVGRERGLHRRPGPLRSTAPLLPGSSGIVWGHTVTFSCAARLASPSNRSPILCSPVPLQFPLKTIPLLCARPDLKGTNPVTGADTRESAMCL